jgi:3-hydroxyacyl-[acyl-carrier-protein] dehydratase
MNSANFASALAALPHGPEFRFLDKLVELEPGRSGSGTFTLQGTEHFLRGHFAGNPIFPGVLMIEAAAQLAGVVAQSDPAIAPLRQMKLTAVRGAKFLGTLQPGETLLLHATILSRMEHLVQAKVTGLVGARKVLDTEVILSGELPPPV